MSWIGLRDRRDGVFSHVGIGRTQRGPFDLNGIVPQGTMMLEFASDPRSGAQRLLDYGSSHPWAAGLRLTLSETGVLTLRHWQGDQVREFSLPTSLVSIATSVTVTYTWDAPMRRGILALDCAQHGILTFSELSAPLPLSYRDSMRMMSDARHCRVTSNAMFVALADRVMPIGVLPTLSGATLVQTPTGEQPISRLRAGHMVLTAAGDTAQVRWCGKVTVPARGRFAPLTMRAPYHGLRHDITAAHDQQLRINGPEVEYLFHTERVSLSVGDLRDNLSVRYAARPLTYDYWQVVLDRAEPLSIAGLAVEGMSIAALRADPSLKAHSVLANLPAELMPSRAVSPVPHLRAYETHTLQKLRAA